MELSGDYHTHTTFSHGTGSIMDNALSARDKGITEIAITDHGFSHPAFGMKNRYLPKMRQEIEEAKRVTGVNVLLGIESNITGSHGEIDAVKKYYEQLDFISAGMHKFVIPARFSDLFSYAGANFFTSLLKIKPSKSLIKTTTRAYIAAIEKNPIDVITHINYCVFADAVEVAKAARDYGTMIEISAKKTHLSDEELFAVASTGVKLIVGSDAHDPSRVGDTALAEKQIERVGIDKKRIVNLRGALEKPSFRFAEYKEKNDLYRRS